MSLYLVYLAVQILILVKKYPNIHFHGFREKNAALERRQPKIFLKTMTIGLNLAYKLVQASASQVTFFKVINSQTACSIHHLCQVRSKTQKS